MGKIHSSAVVEDGVALGADVEIGPFCFVGCGAKLGDGVKLRAHAVVMGDSEIGPGTEVYPHAVLGGPAQFHTQTSVKSTLRVGAGNIIREFVTMNCGTGKGGGITVVGDNGYFMANSHVGHDCKLGNEVTLANSVALGGHVIVGNNVNIGGLTAVVQHVRIGRAAFLGGMSGLPTDLIPYGLAQGPRAYLQGLNVVGLKRRNISREKIHTLRGAFRDLFYGDGLFSERIKIAEQRWQGSPEVDEIITFIKAKAKRQICVPESSADKFSNA
jgi:UDP-N-acetylglucosamine acyltransferase